MPLCADMTSSVCFVRNESLTIIRMEYVGVKNVTIANKYVIYDNELDRKYTYKRNMEARSLATTVAVEMQYILHNVGVSV